MALSFYSNRETKSSFLQAESGLPIELLLGFQDNFTYPNTPLLFAPTDLDNYYYNTTTHHLPPFDNSISLSSPPLFPPQELEPYRYPKRLKRYEEEEQCYYCPDLTPCLADGFIPNPPLLPDFCLPDFNAMPDYDTVKKSVEGERLSTQSIAARQRRRKITDKTQELGNLIPGAHKMNTAEMFQAAYNYIKFLQAQLGILHLMGSIQENEGAMHSQELQALATSPSIHEKLYSSEKCLVPKQFVQSLAKHRDLQSKNSLILEDLAQFIRTSSG